MASEETPVNPNSSFDFIEKLPIELIKEFFCLLPKNLAWDVLNPTNLTLPRFNPPGVAHPWYRRPEIKRWLLSLVYVHYGFELSLNWYNDELQQWLLLPRRQYEQIIQNHAEWPSRVVLCPMDPQGEASWYLDDRIPVHKFWLHPNNGGEVCAIRLPLRSNQHLSRLALYSYTFDGSVSTNHRVDSLQLNGLHPHLDRVIDLSSVKQLSVLARVNIEVFEYASKFTLLKDLFVRGLVAPEDIEAFSKTVTRLVFLIDSQIDLKFVEIVAKFSLLTYFEVTTSVGSFNWPRIWCQLDMWRAARPFISIILRAFEKYQFEQLKTLVIFNYPFRIVRREGIWVATEDIGTDHTLVGVLIPREHP